MKWSIYSIMPKLIIVPGYTELWCVDKRNWMVIKPEDTITLRFNNQSHVVERGYFSIGNDLSIINNTKKTLRINVVIFRNTGLEQMPQMSNVLGVFSIEKYKDFVATLNQILKLNIIEGKICNDITEFFESFVNMSFKLDIKAIRSNRTRIDPRLIWIHRKIRNEFNKQLTLENLADTFKCNPDYLCNTYSKVFKRSPMKQLQIIRISKAMELLDDTCLSIREITQSVGYISQSQFSSYFKKHTGITPSEYRKISLEYKKMEI